MRYEIRIADRIGPLVASALQPARVVSRPQGTRLTILRREPLDAAVLLQRLDQLNLEVESMRCRRIGPGGSKSGIGRMGHDSSSACLMTHTE